MRENGDYVKERKKKRRLIGIETQDKRTLGGPKRRQLGSVKKNLGRAFVRGGAKPGKNKVLRKVLLRENKRK